MNDSHNSPTTAERVESLLENARLRILVVGAGIGGSTLAALLHRAGEKFAVIEKQGSVDAGGYMLGMLPLGARVLNGLGLRDSYHTLSRPIHTYQLYDRHGKKPRSYSLESFVDAYGDWRGITRLALLDLLRSAQDNILYEATVQEMRQTETQVTVTFGDGSTVHVDLVVAAEGVHSPTRKQFWTESEVEMFDTGWGGYVVWSDSAELPMNAFAELWASGWGVGLYPVIDRVGMFVGSSRTHTAAMSPRAFLDEVAAKLPGDSCFAQALSAAEIDDHPFYWPMTDIRTKTSWYKGRVVLLGDACASYLPTAGVGAAQAMDSAAALADELSRTEAERMTYGLKLYEKRQRHRVEATQRNSRRLAKVMFLQSPTLTAMRDQAMNFYPAKMLIREISAIMDGA